MLQKLEINEMEIIQVLQEGNLIAKAHMHGILNQIRDLNLKVISVNLADKQNDNNSINNK